MMRNVGLLSLLGSTRNADTSRGVSGNTCYDEHLAVVYLVDVTGSLDHGQLRHEVQAAKGMHKAMATKATVESATYIFGGFENEENLKAYKAKLKLNYTSWNWEELTSTITYSRMDDPKEADMKLNPNTELAFRDLEAISDHETDLKNGKTLDFRYVREENQQKYLYLHHTLATNYKAALKRSYEVLEKKKKEVDDANTKRQDWQKENWSYLTVLITDGNSSDCGGDSVDECRPSAASEIKVSVLHLGPKNDAIYNKIAAISSCDSSKEYPKEMAVKGTYEDGSHCPYLISKAFTDDSKALEVYNWIFGQTNTVASEWVYSNERYCGENMHVFKEANGTYSCKECADGTVAKFHNLCAKKETKCTASSTTNSPSTTPPLAYPMVHSTTSTQHTTLSTTTTPATILSTSTSPSTTVSTGTIPPTTVSTTTSATTTATTSTRKPNCHSKKKRSAKFHPKKKSGHKKRGAEKKTRHSTKSVPGAKFLARNP